MEYIFNLYSLQITPRLLKISLYLLKYDTECKYPLFTCYVDGMLITYIFIF